MASVFYNLVKHPESYAKLQQEVDAIKTQDTADEHKSRSFSWATAQTMPYLDACIRESMRLHPVQRIPHDRVVPKGGLTIEGHWIPEGVNIGVYPTVLHRNKEIFGEDANVFRPERWLDNTEKVERMKNSMFTFSYGKYTCLGKNISKMEMYKLIPTLLRSFEVRKFRSQVIVC